eukprot:5753122-Prorocentrum_lima.AAC.1
MPRHPGLVLKFSTLPRALRGGLEALHTANGHAKRADLACLTLCTLQFPHAAAAMLARFGLLDLGPALE